jgi:hypothetical protein
MKPRVRRPALLLALLLAVVAASLLILKIAPAPFFWIGLLWAAGFFGAILLVHGSWPRAILFNLGIVACLLAGTEGYLVTREYTPAIVSNGFYVRDDVLGWAPAKGIHAHAIKALPTGLLHGPAGLLFDVSYTIDSNGLRVAPQYRKDDLAGTVLFFGCSFTFGDGLNDNETLPYQVGSQSGGRYRTFNFGVGGYGPEQMLAAIAHGIVGRVVDTAPRYAYYIALPVHVWRVAGRTSMGLHGPRYVPRYVRDEDGKVHQAGNFENLRPLALRLGLNRHVVGQLDKSALWRMFTMGDSRVTDDDVRLYFAIVRRSQELLTAEYPGIQFRVILYPTQQTWQQRAIYEKLREGFGRMGIPVDLVEDILPGYNADQSKFILSAVDTHPNALANRLLAQHVLTKIAQ